MMDIVAEDVERVPVPLAHTPNVTAHDSDTGALELREEDSGAWVSCGTPVEVKQ